MYHYLEESIDKLRTKIIKMGSLVEEQINFAIKAIFESNNEIANLVIERDEKVDKYEVKIDKLCQRIFALTQPVAVDLRLIMSALSINNNLERMGDCAVNIVMDIDKIKNYTYLLPKIGVDKMADLVKLNVKNGLDSFINNDDVLAHEVIISDDIIDKYNRELIKPVIAEMRNNKDMIEAGIYIVDIIRNFERLSDHSTNIAEEVVFLSESKIIKHKKESNNIEDYINPPDNP